MMEDDLFINRWYKDLNIFELMFHVSAFMEINTWVPALLASFWFLTKTAQIHPAPSRQNHDIMGKGLVPQTYVLCFLGSNYIHAKSVRGSFNRFHQLLEWQFLSDITNPLGCEAMSKFVLIWSRRRVFLVSTNGCRQSVSSCCDDEG